MNEVSVTFEDVAYVSTRSGFNHECTAVSSEGRRAHCVCHYINRTWEAWPFQTVKKRAIEMLIRQEVDEDCMKYKQTHKCNGRLPRGYRKQCEEIYKAKYQKAMDKVSSW